MIKDILVQYCDLQKEIEDIKKRIERIENQTSMVSDVVQNGYKRHAVIFGVDVLRKKRLDILENKLRVFCDRLFELQVKIEEYIQSIPDSKTRRIFRYRYFDNMSWIQIGHAMSSTSDAVRMKHDRFLE